jgi:peptide/nickel transport system ATP-binding protein
MTDIALTIVDLSVHDSGGSVLLNRICLTLKTGEPLIIVGETGSGKSLIAQALFGLLPPALRVEGTLLIDGMQIDLGHRDNLQQFWGRRMFLIPQEPRAALDPTMRIGRQVTECSDRGIRDAASALSAVDLPIGTDSLFPHMMSGGMAQRSLVACALHRDAEVIVVDEPTKGLDAARAGRVIRTLHALARDGRAIVVITHDLDVVKKLRGSMAVMCDGEILEQGSTDHVLGAPKHPYTREWLAADPGHWQRQDDGPIGDQAVVAARGITFGFERLRPLFSNISLEIAAGEIVGLMGPSGCGKTTLGNVLLGLQRPHSGTVDWGRTAIAKDGQVGRALRQRYQKLHQDPASSFVPHRTFRQQFGDLTEVVPTWNMSETRPLIESLKLNEKLLDRRPMEVSGGEAQRFAIARALALQPDFLVADEPTSRLDPIVQKGVLDLLRDTCRRRKIGMLMISHHSSMLRAITDRVLDFAALELQARG